MSCISPLQEIRTESLALPEPNHIIAKPIFLSNDYIRKLLGRASGTLGQGRVCEDPTLLFLFFNRKEEFRTPGRT